MIIFGVIRFKKKKFKKIFLVLLAITVLAGIKDYQIVNEFVNYDEIKHQNLIKEEGKELVAIRDNDYNKVEQYLKSGWDPNENTKSVYYSIKYNTESNKKKDEWKILELLLKHGANPDVQIFENKQSKYTINLYRMRLLWSKPNFCWNMVQIVIFKKII